MKMNGGWEMMDDWYWMMIKMMNGDDHDEYDNANEEDDEDKSEYFAKMRP